MKGSVWIKDYFSFNKREQRGLFVLITILMIMIVADVYFSYYRSDAPVDFSEFENEIIAFEKEVKRMDSIKMIYNGKKYFGKTGFYTSFKKDSSQISARKPVKSFFIELNTADTLDLQRLNGIGSVFARRIVKYRDRLGGFIAISQLLEIFGMDTVRFKAILPNLTLNTDSIRKINLNTVTFKQLMSHPYFPFEITKSILIYRNEHKKFKSTDDLREIMLVNDSIFRKILPYIRIE